MTYLLRLSACLFLCVSLNSFGALYDRGNGLIYDDVLDITWLQDINYLYTESGSAHHLSFHSAKQWSENLSYGGFVNWRLPKIFDDSFSYGFNDTTSEIGYMSSINLGNSNGFSNKIFIDALSGEERSFSQHTQFFHLLGGNPLSITSNIQWNSSTGNHISGYWSNLGTAWAVHDGDIGNPVPLPAGIYLFLSGLVGLGLMRGRNA